MKPPPRKRSKPRRELKPEQAPPPRSGRTVRTWKRAEQRNLLNGLKALGENDGGREDIDYSALRKHVPSRAASEIQTVVDSLKNKVMSYAKLELNKTRAEEKKVRKPIEAWTSMASAVAGTLVEPISNAFSQMLIVSSTEPCTLRNCDPPRVNTPPKCDDRPAVRSIPLRPMPCLPAKGKGPGATKAGPLLLIKTPAPTLGPARRLPVPFKVVRVTKGKCQLATAAGTPPAVTSTCPPGAAGTFNTSATSQLPLTAQTVVVQQPKPQQQAKPQQQQQPAAAATTTTTTTISDPTMPSCASSVDGVNSSSATSSSPAAPTCPTPPRSSSSSAAPTCPTPPRSSSSSAAPTCPTPPRSSSSSAAPTCPTPPRSAPASPAHARFGRTSKYATEDTPRTFGVKCVVDFERIYRYLSVVHRPDDECHLTPMENAIVLDLLMSLPEELPRLDCNKLQKHFTQVYQCLSTRAGSSMARERLKGLDRNQGADERQPHAAGSQGGDSAQTERSRIHSAPRQARGRTLRRHNASDSGDATGSGGKQLPPDEAESQPPVGNIVSSRTGDKDDVGPWPPLNPFMVPLKLLMRK